MKGGLGLLVLVSKQDLAAGEFLSFAYLGDFFQRYTPGNVTPPGYKRIRRASGSGGICPNDLERFENNVDQPPSYPGSSSLRKTRAKINWPLCPETSATVQLPLFKTGTLADVRIRSKRGLEAQSASKDSDRSVRPGLKRTRKSVKCGPRPDLVVAPKQRAVKELPTQRQMVKKVALRNFSSVYTESCKGVAVSSAVVRWGSATVSSLGLRLAPAEQRSLDRTLRRIRGVLVRRHSNLVIHWSWYRLHWRRKSIATRILSVKLRQPLVA